MLCWLSVLTEVLEISEREQKKPSKITALQPYLHPAEKSLPSQWCCKCCCCRGNFSPWGCQAEERLEPAPKPACGSCAALPPRGQLSLPGPTFKSSHSKPFTGASFDILLGYQALLVHSQRIYQLQLIPSKSFFPTPPHACHQQITQENREKGYKAAVLLGQTNNYCSFFPQVICIIVHS